MSASRTVVLSEAAYRRLEGYARISGQPLECAASDAVTEWMNSTGDLVIEAIQKNQRAEAPRPKLTLVWGARTA